MSPLPELRVSRSTRIPARFPLRLLPLLLLLLSPPLAGAWRSAYYPDSWTPDHTHPNGGYLHDFSYAGYAAGEVSLPVVTEPVLDAVALHGADPSGLTDSTAAIQATIDDAEAAGGGVVFLRTGDYLLDGRLLIDRDGVVLRGEGPANTRLRFSLSDGTVAFSAHVRLRGDVRWGAELPLASDGAARADHVLVADASSLSVGDEISIGWTITDEFVAEHGMTGVWLQFNGQWRPFFRRTITRIDASVAPHRVELDVPLRYPAKLRDGASIRPLDLVAGRGYLKECGVEDLAVCNAVDPALANAISQVQVFEGDGLKDCWFRNVRSFASPLPIAAGDHVQSGGIRIMGSRRVTVADCRMEMAQNRGGGGNGYLFEIRASGEVLFRDCVGERGRHNFIQNWDFGTSGVVWLRCRSDRGTRSDGFNSYSEYHHSLTMASLVDSCFLGDGWQGGNRMAESSGAGHTTTEGVYWNATGDGFLGSWNYGRGYIVGTDPAITVWTATYIFTYFNGTLPEDSREGLGEAATLEPRSLYDDQLARRLRNAVASDRWSRYD